MRALIAALAVSALALTPSLFFASPTVYPTGTTSYKPEKAWNGFTVTRDFLPRAARIIEVSWEGDVLWD